MPGKKRIVRARLATWRLSFEKSAGEEREIEGCRGEKNLKHGIEKKREKRKKKENKEDERRRASISQCSEKKREEWIGWSGVQRPGRSRSVSLVDLWLAHTLFSVVSFGSLPSFSFYPSMFAIQNADLIRANLTPSSRSCFGELNPSPRCPPSFAASLCLACGKSSIQRGEFKIQT